MVLNEVNKGTGGFGCNTIATAAVNNAAFTGNDLARFEVEDIAANIHSFTNKLMANNQEYWMYSLRPLIPIINVQVCPTDGCK